MRVLNSDAIPKLGCTNCGLEINPDSYTTNGPKREAVYHYPHFCYARYTMEDLDMFKLADSETAEWA